MAHQLRSGASHVLPNNLIHAVRLDTACLVRDVEEFDCWLMASFLQIAATLSRNVLTPGNQDVKVLGVNEVRKAVFIPYRLWWFHTIYWSTKTSAKCNVEN